MVQEDVRWGVINCDTHMRIIRIGRKDGRPYAIISEEIATNRPAPQSAYSLICYMLLTGKEDIPIDAGIGIEVPAPPPIVDSSDPGLQTRAQKARQLDLALTDDVTTVSSSPILYVSTHWLKQLIDDVAHYGCCGQITR